MLYILKFFYLVIFKKNLQILLYFFYALTSEDGGFEPPSRWIGNTVSNGARSTTLPTFHNVERWNDRY